MTKKILVVEDHPDSLNVITLQLDTMGFSVITAKRGKEGVEKASGEKPDLILMDIMMPRMDGREATRRIRANPISKDIPILATTVLCRESELSECIKAGCNDYLVKPFTPKELASRIEKLIM